jgi:uncharacterized damage-inducible protein DinB
MKTVALLTVGLVTLASATATRAAAQAAAAPAVKGIRAEMLAQLDDAAGKLEQLAEAIPQDKYSWRPGAGVRTAGEVLGHVTGGNYYLLTFAGVKMPADAPQSENLGDRAQSVQQMRRSFDHVRSLIRSISDADLDKPATLFGQQSTNRGVLLLTVTHAHEHLGQLIAYARSNGITPPWSRSGGQ